MLDQFARTEVLLGSHGIQQLKNAKVAVFGIGGVGGYVCEALVRSGVSSFVLVDNDRVSLTNINRQIIATHDTLDRLKVDVMKERMLQINPYVQVETRACFFLPENAHEFDFASYDYVVDAVDTVTAKIEIIMKAKEFGVPVISSMGAGNKLDASAFKVADLYKTSVCPLAKVMRRELKKRGVRKLKVVYSEEMPIPGDDRVLASYQEENQDDTGKVIDNVKKRSIPGSVAFVPSVAGLIIAGEVIKDLILLDKKKEILEEI